MKLLLDTVTFLRLSDEVHLLSPTAKETLNDPGNILVLHQASIWEIQIKYNLGKLPLKLPPRQFVPMSVEKHDLVCQSLADADIYFLERLPHLHRDPFDRLLIAHAIHEGLPIVTPDPLIEQYPVRTIW